MSLVVRLGHGASARAAPTARRIREYTGSILGGVRPAYVAAYQASRMIPLFTAGPLVARLYRAAGFQIGEGASFLGPIRIIGGTDSFVENLIVGRNALISTDVTIDVDGLVRIDENASIGPFVRIYTATHSIGPGSRRMMPHILAKPVTIERGAWVGLAALILPGVTIGQGSIVGAGSVVTADVPPNSYVEGNPARVVRQLPWGDR
ncbi:MAG: acyltransferase [Chloroflexi bacterium]|nr:acyltransferase [Chloroflexota bacterium]